MKINYLKMTEEVAKNYFEKAYELFRRVINKDENIYDYNFHFDWSIVEKRHEEVANNDYNENDFYFVYNNEKYGLIISHDIDSFGYNDVFFNERYSDIYDNLYCCTIYIYRNYFEYEDIKAQVTFLYDKKSDKVVEILDISRYSFPKSNMQNIRIMNDDEELKKVLKK